MLARRHFGGAMAGAAAIAEKAEPLLAFVVFRRLRGGMIRVVARDMDDTDRRLFCRK